MSGTVIRVDNLWKEYRLGVTSHRTLSRDLQSWWAGVRGKEDPNSLVGTAAAAKGGADAFWALRDVSFEVGRGEVLGIIGRNGAGKSTLLKILSQVTAPTRGEVRFKGRIASLLEVGTGFHPELTGRENIFVNGAILGMSKAEIRSKLDEIISFAEVEKFIDTPVKRYSSGMYVRLAFAVAAHLEPEILIVDEVLAVGDAQFQKKCLGKMQDIGKEGRTVLFVSHNMGTINTLCTRALWLCGGKIIESGAPHAVIGNYLKSLGESPAQVKRIDAVDDRPFVVSRVRMLNALCEETTAFTCDEDITIKLDATVKKTTRGLYGFLCIRNMYKEKILISDTNDVLPNCLENVQVGLYTLSVTIPSRTLGHGEYFLYLDFASSQSGYAIGNTTSVETLEDILRFTIDDVTTARGNNRGGYFSTIVPWSVQSRASTIS